MSRFSGSILALGVAVAGAACGSDSTAPNQSLSQAEARAVASAMFGNVAASVGSQTPSKNTTGTSESSVPTLTLSVSANCSGGGTVKGTAIFTNDVDLAGTGTKSGSVTVTAEQCNVDTGERILTTDGSYTYSFTAGFTNNVQSSDFVWKANGAFTWTGGSCALDYTVTVTPQGNKSFSGTVCGVDIAATATT